MNTRAIANESLIGRVIDEFTDRLQHGQTPCISEYAERFPEIAEELRQLLPSVQLMSGLSDTADSLSDGIQRVDQYIDGDLGRLGDFRILHEVGRGGMGVVYEAEQISLQRRVALKVLPLVGLLDERHLQRFKNEALAAAQLDHPHIVEIYGVGCQRGVHYYAMQFIEGVTLAAVIDHLRAQRHAF